MIVAFVLFVLWCLVSFLGAIWWGYAHSRSARGPDQWRRYRGVFELRKQAPPLQHLEPRKRV